MFLNFFQGCDSKYASAFDLKIHSRKHSGEAPFSCQVCQRAFRYDPCWDFDSRRHAKNLQLCFAVLFFNVGTPCGVHLFDHLLWPIFQSSIFTHLHYTINASWIPKILVIKVYKKAALTGPQ